MPTTESTKEQNIGNKVVKQCYTCKAEDHEIKDWKMKRNMLLRYTDSRYTNAREMKEKMEQYGTISIRNRKMNMRKHKKNVWYVLQQKQKQREQ